MVTASQARLGSSSLAWRVLHRHDAASVEILVRGLDVDPAVLRPRLKLRGTAALSVILTRIGARPTAFVCTAHRT